MTLLVISFIASAALTVYLLANEQNGDSAVFDYIPIDKK